MVPVTISPPFPSRPGFIQDFCGGGGIFLGLKVQGGDLVKNV